MKISAGLDRQVDQRVTSECLEHVIEKPYAGLYPALAAAVQNDADMKVRLFGGSRDFAYTWHRIS
jgi:hypothetical protein